MGGAGGIRSGVGSGLGVGEGTGGRSGGRITPAAPKLRSRETCPEGSGRLFTLFVIGFQSHRSATGGGAPEFQRVLFAPAGLRVNKFGSILFRNSCWSPQWIHFPIDVGPLGISMSQ